MQQTGDAMFTGLWYPSTAHMVCNKFDNKGVDTEPGGWWLSTPQKNEISSKLVGLPITYEHHGIFDVSELNPEHMHSHLVAASNATNNILKRPVGTVVSSSVLSGKDKAGAGQMAFKIDENSGVVANMIKHDPARRGAVIQAQHVYTESDDSSKTNSHLTVMSASIQASTGDAADSQPAQTEPVLAVSASPDQKKENPGALAHDALVEFSKVNPEAAKTVETVITGMADEVESAKQATTKSQPPAAEAPTPAPATNPQNELGWQIVQSYIEDLWDKFTPEDRKAYGFDKTKLANLARLPEHQKVQHMNRAIMACNNKMMQMNAISNSTEQAGSKRRRVTEESAPAAVAEAPVQQHPEIAPSKMSLREVLMAQFQHSH